MAEREPPRNHDDSISEESVQQGGKKEKSRRPASEKTTAIRKSQDKSAKLTMESFLRYCIPPTAIEGVAVSGDV